MTPQIKANVLTRKMSAAKCSPRSAHGRECQGALLEAADLSVSGRIAPTETVKRLSAIVNFGGECGQPKLNQLRSAISIQSSESESRTRTKGPMLRRVTLLLDKGPMLRRAALLLDKGPMLRRAALLLALALSVAPVAHGC
jgi:hypothetical protein